MITQVPAGVEGSTRDRLLAAAARLFAERGYGETTVGAIENEAGLKPRRGALYRHFPSKEALLEASVQRHLDAIERGRAELAALPLDDLRSGALVMGRWFLDELDAQRYLTHILEQDGDRLPEMRNLVRERIVEFGYAAGEQVIHHWLGERASHVDTAALSLLLMGPLINFRRSTWTFGAPPLNVDDEQLLQAWADICVTLANTL